MTTALTVKDKKKAKFEAKQKKMAEENRAREIARKKRIAKQAENKKRQEDRIEADAFARRNQEPEPPSEFGNQRG